MMDLVLVVIHLRICLLQFFFCTNEITSIVKIDWSYTFPCLETSLLNARINESVSRLKATSFQYGWLYFLPCKLTYISSITLHFISFLDYNGFKHSSSTVNERHALLRPAGWQICHFLFPLSSSVSTALNTIVYLWCSQLLSLKETQTFKAY